MIKDLYYRPEQKYKYKIGRKIASALFGFIAGFLIAALVLIPLILWMR